MRVSCKKGGTLYRGGDVLGEIGKKLRRLQSGRPMGSITPIGNNGLGKDEAGNIFKIESYEAANQKKIEGYKKLDKRNFTFAHMQHLREVTDNLSNKLCGYILMLQPYIQFKTNILANPGRNGSPLDDKGIAKALGVTPRTVRTALADLTKADVIKLSEGGYYKINERYHFRKRSGGDIDMLVKTFHTTLKSLKLSAAELGCIYKMLPFVHYRSNILCLNPFEEDRQKVRFLNLSQVAEKIGVPRQKIDQTLRNLTKAGAIATITSRETIMLDETLDKVNNDDRERLVILNPRIVSRLRGEHHNETINQIFR